MINKIFSDAGRQGGGRGIGRLRGRGGRGPAPTVNRLPM